MPSAPCAPVKLIPGPRGNDGVNGAAGTNGLNATTLLLANFTVPVVGGTAIANVAASGWISIGQPLALQNGGVFYATALPDSTHVTLQNPAAETGNVAPATVVALGNRLSPAGFKGTPGAAGGAGTGVTVATKGDIQTFAGAATNLAVGTDGQLLRSLAAAGTGLDWEQIIPNATGAADDNKIAIANCPVGNETPANIQFTLAKVTDTGAYQTVGGNARGVDSVDQQPARVAANQVASGNNSTIAGGRNNRSSAQGSTVGGGEGNIASGSASGVASGANNTASGALSSVLGGNLNVASGIRSAICGGEANVASGTNCAVLGGTTNVASVDGSVAFGDNNTASALKSATLGGVLNTASGDYSVTIGGSQALSTLYGQVAHSSGAFASAGDAQVSELIWRIATTDATANVEMFLDGATGTRRATVPSNTTWAFDIIGVARRSNGDSITFGVKGGIKNDAGTTVLVAAVTAAVIADGTGAALTIANFTVDADNANDALRIRVQGIVAQNWRWTAHARIVELGF